MLEFVHEPEPALTFTLYDEWGRPVWPPLTLAASELRNGVESWRSKIVQ
jgi:hypothetical protein